MKRNTNNVRQSDVQRTSNLKINQNYYASKSFDDYERIHEREEPVTDKEKEMEEKITKQIREEKTNFLGQYDMSGLGGYRKTGQNPGVNRVQMRNNQVGFYLLSLLPFYFYSYNTCC